MASLRYLLLVACAAVGSACATQKRELHSVSGNEFTLFPGDRRAPPPIICKGETEERFACFARELETRGKKLDVAGAFALSTPDGKIRTIVRTDELNETTLKVTADTRFPAASLSKMFLAAATVSLSLEGSLDLQVPISRYLPELGGAGVGSATLHQLLTHTSGLGNPPQCEKKEDDLADALKKHGPERLLAPPGAVFNYSNLGYTFVALVLERVTGKPFEAVVRERVLIPAGIPGASYGPAQVAVRGHAPDSVQIMARCRAMWPSGGLVLSVRELGHWAGEMARPQASRLGQPVLDLLTAPHVDAVDLPGAAYGYGVQRLEQSGLTIFNHTGRLPDFSAFVAWSPARQLGVAAFANRREPFAVAAGFRALSTFLAISEDWQPAAGAAHPLSAYTGVYVDQGGTLGRLRVSLEGKALVIDYLNRPPPLLPADFRFVFETGAPRARYVVTSVGVGQRSAE